LIGYKTGHRKELSSDADSLVHGGQCPAPGTGVTPAADCRNYTVRCQEGFPFDVAQGGEPVEPRIKPGMTKQQYI